MKLDPNWIDDICFDRWREVGLDTLLTEIGPTMALLVDGDGQPIDVVRLGVAGAEALEA